MTPRTLRGRLTGRDGDEGSITLWWVITLAGALIMIGLVVDLGGKMRSIEYADSLASEAARAGAQAVDPGKAVSGQRIVIDPARAVAAADDYLARAGVTGTATPGPDGTSITVHVTVRHKTLFLQAIGVDTLQADGQAGATLLHGVTAPEG